MFITNACQKAIFSRGCKTITFLYPLKGLDRRPYPLLEFLKKR
jgi:hypothetical protein